jgi:hypothetical protein
MLGYPFLFMHWNRQFRIQHAAAGATLGCAKHFITVTNASFVFANAQGCQA